jgi:hypothetical protein
VGEQRGRFFHSKEAQQKKKKINLKTLNKPPGDEKNIKSSATRVFSLSLSLCKKKKSLATFSKLR